MPSDFFLYPDGHGRSAMTMKVTGILKSFGIPTTLMSMVFVFIFLFLLTAIVQTYGNLLMLRTKYYLSKDLMMGFFRDIFDAKWLFFTISEQGKTFNTVSRELMGTGDGFNAIGTIFSGLIQITIFLAIPLYISWKVTLLCLLFGGIASLIFIYFSRYSYKLGMRTTQAANVLSGLIYENISSAKLVLGFGDPQRMIGKSVPHMTII